MHKKITPHQNSDMIGGATGLKENEIAQTGGSQGNAVSKLQLFTGCSGDREAESVSHNQSDKCRTVHAIGRTSTQAVGSSFPFLKLLYQALFRIGYTAGAAAGNQ